MDTRGIPAALGLPLLLVCAGAGCSGDPLSPERAGISFRVAGSAFDRGDTIVASLENGSDRELGYNLCLADLEREAASMWERIPRRDGFCPLIMLILEPGESARLTQPASDEFPTGVNRFRIEIEWPVHGPRFAVTTDRFHIE